MLFICSYCNDDLKINTNPVKAKREAQNKFGWLVDCDIEVRISNGLAGVRGGVAHRITLCPRCWTIHCKLTSMIDNFQYISDDLEIVTAEYLRRAIDEIKVLFINPAEKALEDNDRHEIAKELRNIRRIVYASK